ncbi:hypothetical protein B0H17DRAFT_1142332 [Mycena rosella]|uniref:Uncharacterized protein n=1 Tax=Mycena rosella TaxID=1033263 RepID=A0AAD7G9H8_MYCRO|nr:hypothetical protein B0H17DRAFT_1142332 [Mycena rosella]
MYEDLESTGKIATADKERRSLSSVRALCCTTTTAVNERRQFVPNGPAPWQLLAPRGHVRVRSCIKAARADKTPGTQRCCSLLKASDNVPRDFAEGVRQRPARAPAVAAHRTEIVAQLGVQLGSKLTHAARGCRLSEITSRRSFEAVRNWFVDVRAHMSCIPFGNKDEFVRGDGAFIHLALVGPCGVWLSGGGSTRRRGTILMPRVVYSADVQRNDGTEPLARRRLNMMALRHGQGVPVRLPVARCRRGVSDRPCGVCCEPDAVIRAPRAELVCSRRPAGDGFQQRKVSGTRVRRRGRLSLGFIRDGASSELTMGFARPASLALRAFWWSPAIFPFDPR